MNRALLLLLSVLSLPLFGKVFISPVAVEVQTTDSQPMPTPAPSAVEAPKFLMDTVPPTITCPNSDNIFLTVQGACDTVLSYSVTATDDQGPAIVIQLSGVPSGSAFPLGTNICTFLATDLSGNTATCSFSFFVDDAAPILLTCNDLVYVHLEGNCTAELLAEEALEGGPYGCWDRYLVEKDVTIPFGNGPWLPATFNSSDLDKTYQYRITDSESGNKCWGNVKSIDTDPPVFDCADIVVSCAQEDVSPAFLEDSLGIAAGRPSVNDACGPLTFVGHFDTNNAYNCDSAFAGVVTRLWQANDESGNTSTCIQRIKKYRHTIDEIQFPPDVTLHCPATNTEPEQTGLPFLMYQGRRYNMENNSICDLSAFYEDYPLRIACGDTRIRRVWEIFDFCTGETEGPFLQNIYILDESSPSIACPASLFVSMSADTCHVSFDLPDAVLNDGCSQLASFQAFWEEDGLAKTLLGSLSDFPGNDPNSFDTLGVLGAAVFPVGTTTVTYVTEDSCGNIGDCTFNLTVADMMPPAAICDSFLTAQLLADGTLAIGAASLDNGSADDCAALSFKARFVETGACLFDTVWTDSLRFCCLDKNDTLDAVLRVYDIPVPSGNVGESYGIGHHSDCALKILITDPHPPSCVAPPNVSVNCEDFDPTLEAYGFLTTYSCAVDSQSVEVDYTDFDTTCNRGTLTRVFKVFDESGTVGACAQGVTVHYAQDYFTKFPDDAIVTMCDGTGNFGEPVFFGEDCENFDISYTDEIFYVVPDACFKIERTWTIINLCTYDTTKPLINVPNPNPHATTNHPTNLPGPTVSACGTLPPWSPTVVKIAPTDPSATNFCTFFDADANGYKYKQIIKVIDNQDPTGVYAVPDCSNQNWATSNNPLLWHESYWWDNTLQQSDLCEEPTELSITATDACSGANVNIEFLLFLDMDGDGVMETVVNSTTLGVAGLGWNNVLFNNLNTPNYSGGTPRAFDERPVAANQKMGFAIEETISGNEKTARVRWNTQQNPDDYFTPELPHGTHKIRWFLTDGCGNNQEYEYSFTVKDCKTPTVVCNNGLSVNLIPNQGNQITVWASDFLQYTEDNCTPTNQIKIATRKCGTGTGFPVDGNGTPIPSVTFDCLELGTQCVELWAIDKAGNADKCETTVTVHDNLDPCFHVGPSVAGYIRTELGEGIEGVSIHIEGDCNFCPPFSYFGMNDTDTSGRYFISNQIPFTSDFRIKPVEDDNPLNGVTTLDLILISKHILAVEPFDSPYKMISADANKSESITSFDIVELRKLILGIYSELPNNTSWRFVDSNFVFPNPLNPFQTGFPDTIPIQNLMNSMLGLDFIGMKIGDVNLTAIPHFQSPVKERFEGMAYFDVEDRDVQEGEVFEVRFKAADWLQGCQFTLETDALEVLEILPGEGLARENFALFPEKSMLTMAWESGGWASFGLKCRAQKAGRLADLLRISDQITPAEAYPQNNIAATKSRLSLRFGLVGAAFELFQNQPNPFSEKTSISFQLPESSAATLTIFDGSGKVLWTQSGEWAAGLNTVDVDLRKIGQAGVLYCKLQTPTRSAVRKMVRI